MALTIIQIPIQTGTVSVSYPFIVKVQTTEYGTAGVSHFRFVAKIEIGGEVVMTKKTVVDDVTAKTGKFDFSDTLKIFVELSRWARGEIGTKAITQITDKSQTASFDPVDVSIYFSQEYFNGSTFVSSTPIKQDFKIYRGFTTLPDSEVEFANWHDLTDMQRLLFFSGKHWTVFPVNINKHDYPSKVAFPYLLVQERAYFVNDPSPTLIAQYWMNRNTIDDVYYLPMKKEGVTDRDDFEALDFKFFVSPTEGGSLTFADEYRIYKTVFWCEDEEVVVMFRDRFFQWSFMSFAKKHRDIDNSTQQDAEAPRYAENSGRYRYNVEVARTVDCNTDWLTEEQNELVQDLFASEDMYFVNIGDGSLDRCVIQESQVLYKTKRNDSLIQYRFSFKKSDNNFKA